VYEARASAPPGELPPEITEHYSKKEREEEREKERQQELKEGRETEEEKEFVESQIEAIGEEEHMTGADELKEKHNESLEKMAESSRHPSFPDAEKSAELIAAQSRTAANDNDPQHDGRTPANGNQPGRRDIPAADKPVAMSARAGAGAGLPDPDPPASTIAARAPANDIQPGIPANDNDQDL
jgi:preprotein translocase subunit SecD